MKNKRKIRIAALPAFRVCYVNPYPCLLYKNFPTESFEVEEFRFSRFFTKRYEIFHVHWPVKELVDAHKPLRSFTKVLFMVLALKTLKLRGTRLIWTAHNVEPHEKALSWLISWYWPIFLSHLDGYISLSETIAKDAETAYPHLQNIPRCIIPHGHYRDAYENGIDQKTAKEKLKVPVTKKAALFLGLIRSYKNVPKLIKTFKLLDDDNWVLIIAGKPSNPEEAELLRNLVNSDPRIHLHLKFVANEELQLYFNAVDLVILPFRKIANSGSALLALSFNCPIAVPNLGAMQELQTQVSLDWIRTYAGELTPETLNEVLAWARTRKTDENAPLMSLSWSNISERTAIFFENIKNQKYKI